jgi:hypothetical protein
MSTCTHHTFGSSASINDVCTQCGSIIAETPPAKQKRSDKSAESSGVVKKKRRPYQARKTPYMLLKKEFRKQVKIDMIAAVPGISRAKAEAVVSACDGSMATMVGVSSTEFARVVYLGAPIGKDLGVAIWRALH